MITQAQKEFRKGKIGASDCAAALGISPWMSQAGLYHEIIGNIEREDIGPKGRIGNAMEPVIIQEYEIETGNKVVPVQDTLIHPKYNWMICHLDGRIPDKNKVLELKNVGPTMFYHWGEDGDPKGVPIYVTAQCVQQAILADVEAVDVAAFFGGNELRVYPLEITKEAKQTVLGGLVRFWESYVVPRVQPILTEQDAKLIKELYWNANNEKVLEIESTESAIMFQEYRELKATIKEMEKKEQNIKVNIQDYMGDAGILMRGDDIEFTFKKTKDSQKIDWETAFLQIEEEGCVPKEYADRIIRENTSIKKGHRVFLDKGK